MLIYLLKNTETTDTLIPYQAGSAGDSNLLRFNFSQKFDARPSANPLQDSICEMEQLVPTGYKQLE